MIEARRKPPPPPRPDRSPRALDVMDAARRVLELEGPDALTMRRLGEKLGIKAPSIYKHFPDKAALELALVEQAMVEIGNVRHGAIIAPRDRNTTRNVRRKTFRVTCIALAPRSKMNWRS